MHSGNPCLVVVNENKMDILPIFILHCSCVSHTYREKAAHMTDSLDVEFCGRIFISFINNYINIIIYNYIYIYIFIYIF